MNMNQLTKLKFRLNREAQAVHEASRGRVPMHLCRHIALKQWGFDEQEEYSRLKRLKKRGQIH